MPGSFCTVCRRRIAKGSRCSRHRTVSPSSRSWHERGAQRVHDLVLERDGYRCTNCGATERLEVHHIVAAEDGGPMTMENLTTLCFDHHREAEAEKRG
jgi:5-methylcytosine-specific restriction endonuclease McrA